MSKKVRFDLRKNKVKKITTNANKDIDLSFIKKNKKKRKTTHMLYRNIPSMKDYIDALDKGNKPLMKYISIGKIKKINKIFVYRIEHKEKSGVIKVKIQMLKPFENKSMVKRIPYNKTGSKQSKLEKAEYKAKKYVIQEGRKILKKAGIN